MDNIPKVSDANTKAGHQRQARCFIFDVDGVLNDYVAMDYRKYLANKSGNALEKVAEVLMDTKSPLRDLIQNTISLGEFNVKVASALNMNPEDIDWIEYYKRVKPNHETLAIVRDLTARGYVTAFMTNSDKNRYDLTVASICGSIPLGFAAYQLGSSKPEKESYERAMARITEATSEHFSYGETVFIDDSKKNVDGAKAVGMIAILFTSAEALKAELECLISAGQRKPC
jgi:HAD superfamily hydrolase (TIGR01509 family)